MTARLEAHAVDTAVHFGDAQDLRDLLGDRGALGNVNGLAAEAPRLGQALWNQVADDDAGRPQQVAGRRARQSHRPPSGNIDRRARGDARAHRAVIARRQDV